MFKQIEILFLFIIIVEIKEIRMAGATKIQSILRGYSTRKKEVKFNDVVGKKEYRKSEAIGS